jgi:hypothetical protein
MSDTQFWVDVDPDSELGRAMAEKTQVPGATVYSFETSEKVTLEWDRDTGRWYVPDYNYAVLTVPAYLSRSSLTIREITANRTNLVFTRKAPYCGQYAGKGKFHGYTGRVWSYGSKSGSGLMAASVSGPPELLEDFYNRVLSGNIKPAEWREPKPWWWRLRHPLG